MAGRKTPPNARPDVVKALSAGNTRRASCAYAGISEDTLALWMKRDADFADAVEKAEADAEVRHVANIAKAAGEGVWTASAWWLERRRNKDWGRVDRVQVEHVIRKEAERIAAEFGLPVEQVLREAGVQVAN